MWFQILFSIFELQLCRFGLNGVSRKYTIRTQEGGDVKEPRKQKEEPFRLNDPRQQRIHRNLLLVGPGPAAFYSDACRLMAREDLLASTTHVVGHLLREIESALRDVLEPVSQYSSQRDVPEIDKHNETHRWEIYVILAGLEIDEKDSIAEAWLRLSDKSNKYSLNKLAHRKGLTRPRAVDHEFRTFWAEMEAVLDIVLERFREKYLVVFRILDQLIAKHKPTPSDVKELKDRVPCNLETFGYFFDKCQSPEWLGPLRDCGFFQSPPEPKSEAEGGPIRFPTWPHARYLARMASLTPEEVLKIILEIPDTENIRVHEDLVEAALGMPAHLAAQLLEKAKTWAHSAYRLLLPEKLGALVAHLAMGSEVDAALGLARVLLQVRPGGDPRTESERDQGWQVLTQSVARLDTLQYEQIVKKDFPELVKAAGIRAVELLCDFLETAVDFSRTPAEKEPPEDLSWVWRPAIEEHAQNLAPGVMETLVSGVRDSAESLAQTDTANVPEIVRTLEARPWRIFHRIALYLLRKFPDAACDLVAERLTNPALFDNTGVRHEYALLAGERFGGLSREEQSVILDWIETGPDFDQFKEIHELQTGKKATDEDVDHHKRLWQRDRLAWFKTHLPQQWKDRYEALVAEFGEPEHPEFASYVTTGFYGPRSPKAAEDLRSMSVYAIVEFLKSWRPTGDSMGPSPEGLSRQLSELVAEEPARFAAEAMRFQDLDPTYVRALVSGLREAIKQNRTLDWSSVLDLCRWVVSQPREIPGRQTEGMDADADWGWTRQYIAKLFSQGFQEHTGCIPFDLRSVAWEVLYPLTDDPDPTPQHESRYGPPNMGPATLSINTTRGEAMHAVVEYALWVHRNLGKLPDGERRVSQGFAEMPEVRKVLEAHLDPLRDPSLAIRAVYGQRFPWLVLLDAQWARNQTLTIFPLDDSEETLRTAAWETYIIFCRPYNNVLGTLRDQYEVAVEHIGRSTKGGKLADPDERLGEHLMTFYWRGKLEMDDPQGLLPKFWTKASDQLRAHALKFIGQGLRKAKETVPPVILKRLQSLWDSRLAAAHLDPANHRSEMAAFGWSFVSEKFNDEWAMKQLAEALRIAQKTDVDHMVVQRLAALVQTIPLETVHCLELIVKGDLEGWSIYGWREHARTILAIAVQGGDREAAMAAENLIHYAGSAGHLEFRDLLSGR